MKQSEQASPPSVAPVVLRVTGFTTREFHVHPDGRVTRIEHSKERLYSVRDGAFDAARDRESLRLLLRAAELDATFTGEEPDALLEDVEVLELSVRLDAHTLQREGRRDTASEALEGFLQWLDRLPTQERPGEWTAARLVRAPRHLGLEDLTTPKVFERYGMEFLDGADCSAAQAGLLETLALEPIRTHVFPNRTASLDEIESTTNVRWRGRDFILLTAHPPRPPD